MKKFILTLAAGLALMSSAAIAAPTYSDGLFFKPYVGADYDYASINYNKNLGGTPFSGNDFAASSLNGGDVHIGARVHKNLGFEFGYLDTLKSKDNIFNGNEQTKLGLSGYTLDALGYVPVDEAKKFELIGTVGVSRLTGKVSATGAFVGSQSVSETKGRVGVGAQYWLTNNLNVREITRYQAADFSAYGITPVKDIIISTIGINYQF